MSDMRSFSEEQKQYLSGFMMGADVARAVKGLPVIAGIAAAQGGGAATGSANAASAVLQLGPGGVQWGGGAGANAAGDVSAGNEPAMIGAQDRTVAEGKKLIPEELAKRTRFPLDRWDEVAQRCADGKFPSGTDVLMTKYFGLFYVAPAQDSYMCRLRFPGGLVTSYQLQGLADLVDRSAAGHADVTTRANLQIRQIPADQGMEILYGIRALGIINTGAGADNIRNVTASALSGIDPYELIETFPVAHRMHHYILQHRAMFGLPRKFNIAFDGAGSIAALEDTNDIAFTAVRVEESQADEGLPAGVYFQLGLGGITGHKDFAKPTQVLVREDEAVSLAGAIVMLFLQHGDRTDRKKARLKYLLDRWGHEKFLDQLEQQWGKKLRRVDPQRFVIERHERRMAHVGVHPQKQVEKCYIGVVLPVGRLTSDQMRGLAKIAQRFGDGELRLTVWQNLIIPHVHRSDVQEVVARIEQLGLSCDATAFRAGLVACTGSAGCKFAAANTKRHAIELAESLEQRFGTLDQPINIHFTGCHHSCAQHYIGDIGLIACKVERDEELVEGYHVHVGGGWGNQQAIGRQVAASVPADGLSSVVESLIADYLKQRTSDESFWAYSRRMSEAESGA
jgi:ferredoxin-nitrite reductase